MSQETASIKEAAQLVIDRLGYSKEQADNFIRIDLRASFPILRSKQGGKFILGVTRMYLDDQFYDASMISSLNQTLKYIVTPRITTNMTETLTAYPHNNLLTGSNRQGLMILKKTRLNWVLLNIPKILNIK